MKHLLVTNDFPPKIGGIQTLLWELWRRLDPSSFTVLTSPHPGSSGFDAAQPYRVERVREPVLLPHPIMAKRIRALAHETGAELVVIDPAFPLGAIGPDLGLPYWVLVHGAELTVPSKLPGSRQLLARSLSGAQHVVTSGTYPAAEARRIIGGHVPVTSIPPGVDTTRFRPLSAIERRNARKEFGLPLDTPVILGLSRLVRRKGFDTAIRAVNALKHVHPNLLLVLAGAGRDVGRLRRLTSKLEAPVRFLGTVSHDAMPRLYGCVDIFTMLCRNQWGGWEQEGFGIVFLEAAACGIVAVAGDSGGACEAVLDGETGIVVADAHRRERAVEQAAAAYDVLLQSPTTRHTMGAAARRRATEHYTYGALSAQLADLLGVSTIPPA